eukprot:UC4_evm1s580
MSMWADLDVSSAEEDDDFTNLAPEIVASGLTSSPSFVGDDNYFNPAPTKSSSSNPNDQYFYMETATKEAGVTAEDYIVPNETILNQIQKDSENYLDTTFNKAENPDDNYIYTGVAEGKSENNNYLDTNFKSEAIAEPDFNPTKAEPDDTIKDAEDDFNSSLGKRIPVEDERQIHEEWESEKIDERSSKFHNNMFKALWLVTNLLSFILMLLAFISTDWVVERKGFFGPGSTKKAYGVNMHTNCGLGPDVCGSRSYGLTAQQLGNGASSEHFPFDKLPGAWKIAYVCMALSIVSTVLAIMCIVGTMMSERGGILKLGRTMTLSGLGFVFIGMLIFPFGLQDKLFSCYGTKKDEEESYFLCDPWALGNAGLYMVFVIIFFSVGAAVMFIVHSRRERREALVKPRMPFIDVSEYYIVGNYVYTADDFQGVIAVSGKIAKNEFNSMDVSKPGGRFGQTFHRIKKQDYELNPIEYWNSEPTEEDKALEQQRKEAEALAIEQKEVTFQALSNSEDHAAAIILQDDVKLEFEENPRTKTLRKRATTTSSEYLSPTVHSDFANAGQDQANTWTTLQRGMISKFEPQDAGGLDNPAYDYGYMSMGNEGTREINDE